MYRNEVEAGQAIRQYPRDRIFVTTKWSGTQGLGVEESIHNSLKNVGRQYRQMESKPYYTPFSWVLLMSIST
jgi:diketogulonate reductase-like aldo/keto reductase